MDTPQKPASPAFKHLFGPVRSRRLGISLGVDMVPAKICSLDCVYCECGSTSCHSAERREYVPAADLIAELEAYLSTEPVLDYVTFAGTGEPTLNSAIGTVLQYVHDNYPRYHTALLTNGTLLHDPAVREEIVLFDLVLPSLDAVFQETFEKINRPAPGLDAEMVIEGLRAFAREYTGQLWVELFLAEGVNDSESELARFREVLLEINPARVQLNSLDRPGTCEWVQPLSRQRLEQIADQLAPLPVEIISRAGTQTKPTMQLAGAKEVILSSLARRPATIEDLAAASGMTVERINTVLEELENDHLITTKTLSDRRFYLPST